MVDSSPPDRSRAKPSTTTSAVWSDSLGRAGSRSAQILLVSVIIVGFVWLLVRLSVVVIAGVLASILASAVYPFVRWLVGKGWSRLLATLAAFFSILIIFGGLVTGLVFAIQNQWEELADSAVEGWKALQDFVSSGPLPIDTESVDGAMEQVTDFLTSPAFVGDALGGIGAATLFITGAILMVVMLFFFLKDGPTIWNFTLRWFHGSTRAKVAESGDRTVEILGSYVRGTAIIAAVDAIFIGIGLVILGVPLAIPLAVIVFIGAFIPIVGATLAGILATLVALMANGPIVALVALLIVIGVNQLEGNLLQPVVMGRTLRLHALIVLLALTVGTLVGGIFGALLAVPLTAVAWAVIQVWAGDAYHSGLDPILGEDPLSIKSRPSERASRAQRWKYTRMRTQEDPPSPPEATPPGPEGNETEVGNEGGSDTGR